MNYGSFEMASPQPTDGSRRARKKARTRREIFATALRLFGDRGFERVTVEQICAAADVAKGTFFLHFPSKAALLSEWGHELAGELAEALRDHRGSSLSEYRMLAERIGDHWLRRPEATRALLRERLAPERTAGEASREDPLRDLITDVVQRGQNAGALRRNISAPLAAELFLASCAAAFATTVDTRDDPERSEQIRNELLHALLHGMHEPKPRLRWKPS
jgi:AcrR family transcriptional regulator